MPTTIEPKTSPKNQTHKKAELGYGAIALLFASLAVASTVAEYNLYQHKQAEHQNYVKLHEQGTLTDNWIYQMSNDARYSCFPCDLAKLEVLAKAPDIQQSFLDRQKPIAAQHFVAPIGAGVVSLVSLSCIVSLRRLKSKEEKATTKKAPIDLDLQVSPA